MNNEFESILGFAAEMHDHARILVGDCDLFEMTDSELRRMFRQSFWHAVKWCWEKTHIERNSVDFQPASDDQVRKNLVMVSVQNIILENFVKAVSKQKERVNHPEFPGPGAHTMEETEIGIRAQEVLLELERMRAEFVYGRCDIYD